MIQVQQLKRLRKDYGLTQREVGRLLGVTEATVSKYENEVLRPDIETWEQLANIFGCTLEFVQVERLKTRQEHGFYQHKFPREILALSFEDKIDYLFVKLEDDNIQRIAQYTGNPLENRVDMMLYESLTLNQVKALFVEGLALMTPELLFDILSETYLGDEEIVHFLRQELREWLPDILDDEDMLTTVCGLALIPRSTNPYKIGEVYLLNAEGEHVGRDLSDEFRMYFEDYLGMMKPFIAQYPTLSL